MALIKCKGCGRMISSRATICPHCGHSVEDSLKAANGGDVSENPRSENKSSDASEGNETQASTELLYDDDNPKKANKALKAIVIVLVLIVVGLGCFILSQGIMKMTNKPEALISEEYDTLAVDTVEEEPEKEEGQVEDVEMFGPDSMSVPSDASPSTSGEEEPGFRTSADVENHVVGNSYYHGDVSLSITNEGIYANGNKISTSRPRFIRKSLKLGEVKASPSISILVRYDYNQLVDNHSGDVYERNY